MTIMPWTGPGANPEQPWDITRRRRGGLFGASAQPPVSALDGGINDPAATPKKGFDWRKALGVLGDSLSIAGGGQAQYVPGLIENRQRQQAAAYAAQQQEAQRQSALADWVWKQQYEANHRPPPAPHYWETNDGSLGMVGPDGKPQIVYEDKTPKIQWITFDNGDGTKSVIPYGPNGPLGQSPGSMPQRPKGKLTPYNGGPTPTASGGFR